MSSLRYKALGALVLLLVSTSKAFCEDSVDLVPAIRKANHESLKLMSASLTNDANSCVRFSFGYIQEGDAQIELSNLPQQWTTSWNKFRALSMTMKSSTVEPLFLDLKHAGITKTLVIEPLQNVRLKVVVPFENNHFHAREFGSSVGAKAWPTRLSAPKQLDSMVFRMHYPAAASELTLCSMQLLEDPVPTEILDRKAIIDKFGQWKSASWPGKVASQDDLQTLWTTERLPEVDFGYCPLGGDKRTTLRSTGFFRTDKLQGRWTLVDPHGHPFFSAGMDLAQIRNSSFGTPAAGNEFLFASLPPQGPAWIKEKDGSLVSFYVANIMKRYGVNWEEKADAHLIQRLKNWGFNSFGNWSDGKLASKNAFPYVLPLYGWYTKKMFYYPYSLPDVFSDEFQKTAEAAALEQCKKHADDASLIGWFLDNEPVWGTSFETEKSWADIVLDDPEPSATKTYLKEKLSRDPKNAAAIKEHFLYDCLEKYLTVITRAVRKADGHHLILGVRFAGAPDEDWLKLSALFDVLSVNIYTKELAPDSTQVHHWAEVSGRPVLIGEFTSGAPGRGLQGFFYGRFKAKDQAERGVAYRYFVENAAAHPDIVGTHWFQLVDDMPTGRNDGERINYGFLNVLDVPYEPLVAAARETHQRLYALMFGKEKPSQVVPRMN